MAEAAPATKDSVAMATVAVGGTDRGRRSYRNHLCNFWHPVPVQFAICQRIFMTKHICKKAKTFQKRWRPCS